MKQISTVKLNNDVVVPRGRVPELFALVEATSTGVRSSDRIIRACRRRKHSREHHGAARRQQSRWSERAAPSAGFSKASWPLEGSISGEHGIGFTKAAYLGLELSADEIALMKRVKAAFDPHGILNPGKIFPDG